MSTFYGYVRGGSLNLRQSTSTGSTSLATIPNETELMVEEVTGHNDWFKTTYNNITGYVVAQYIAIPSGIDTCVVTTPSGSLNIRKTPVSGATVIYTAAQNSTLVLLDSTSNSGWYRISSPSGTGWAVSSYLTIGGGSSNTLTVSQYLANLESFCNCGWTYGNGYNASTMTIDCAWYPFKARNDLGYHGCTSEYNSISSSNKGTISSLGGYDSLVPGMEVFQQDSSDPAKKGHMGVYAGKVVLNGTLQHAVYQSCSSHNNIDVKYNQGVPSDSGPNLTGMNNKWKYWAWSPYIDHT